MDLEVKLSTPKPTLLFFFFYLNGSFQSHYIFKGLCLVYYTIQSIVFLYIFMLLHSYIHYS